MTLITRTLTITLLLFPLLLRAVGPADAQTIWRLLDYVAVDYPNAVQAGAVVATGEYAEMQDFAGTVQREIAALPPKAQQSDLVKGASALTAAITSKADGAVVATLARQLATELLSAYPVPLAPSAAPDLAKGTALYATQCSGCHGTMGRGDGPLAANLTPKPVNFTDATRARERSIFGLYQVVTQGLDGTSMPSFAALPDADRWALAFTVGQFAFPASEVDAGKALWEGKPQFREALPNLEALVSQRPASLATSSDEATASALTAYLRRHPEAVLPTRTQSLQIVRAHLAEAVAAYQQGNRESAGRLAVAAYLDGFEPLEPVLAIKAPDLMRTIETAMTGLRGQIASGVEPKQIEQAVAGIESNLALAETALDTNSSSAGSAFAGAFAILLREGVEALLVVVAILAFLRKAGRAEAIRYVHGGTLVALLGGVATWGAATYLVTISGASREVIEGASGLFAAAVLVFIGIWMHGKSQAGAWQQYVRQKIGAALSKQSLWGLFVLSFVVVYREVFETILFYVALWSQGNGHAVIAGALAASASLAVIAWLLLRYSKRLPLAQFFSWSALLMALLAVVLTGKGVAGLQEANLISSQLINLPRVDLLGFYPTAQGVMAQALCAAVLILGFLWNRHTANQKVESRPVVERSQ
ncbi:iron permease [Stagnimonas aquatica]|uniref:Iron permease n=1 Tax=Stagnimonas aquatica TaxID=2689987 RepID=A0A3N0VAG2_9GAMM|nr:cytochrome c/FTR1 family iron permease [Stagnimonas aquatica]ROH89695.1 iron permease [Stagnimonas aquatica]